MDFVSATIGVTFARHKNFREFGAALDNPSPAT